MLEPSESRLRECCKIHSEGVRRPIEGRLKKVRGALSGPVLPVKGHFGRIFADRTDIYAAFRANLVQTLRVFPPFVDQADQSLV